MLRIRADQLRLMEQREENEFVRVLADMARRVLPQIERYKEDELLRIIKQQVQDAREAGLRNERGIDLYVFCALRFPGFPENYPELEDIVSNESIPEERRIKAIRDAEARMSDE